MEGVKTIELDDRTYYYDGKNFFDDAFIILRGVELQKVAGKYYDGFDYEQFSPSVLLKYIQRLKGNDLIYKAKKVSEYGLNKYPKEFDFVDRVLPIFTSCCRKMNRPQEAIAVAEKFFSRLGSSVFLCTSLAAAYCDLGDYEKAKTYALTAYAKQGGGTGYRNELALVFARLKAETGETLFEDK